ncbi:uncharacterized protein LOC108958526 [Eucalyptus grandis]|uniref:uncharacterized protein LOC108958526 n=1 Tax=Eucalyptus grandis TaxID=71139 RepID=UPI00192E8C0E|nr:uncharacterized protein LOC108958526 [Eucalyptus grandis]
MALFVFLPGPHSPHSPQALTPSSSCFCAPSSASTSFVAIVAFRALTIETTSGSVSILGQACRHQSGRNLQLLGREPSRPSHAARFVCRHRRLSGSGDIICEWVGFIFELGRVGTKAEEVFKCWVPRPLHVHTPLASFIAVVAFLGRAIETGSGSFLISGSGTTPAILKPKQKKLAISGSRASPPSQVARMSSLDSVSPCHRYRILSHKMKSTLYYWLS